MVKGGGFLGGGCMGEEATNIMDERMNNSFSLRFEDGQMALNGKGRISSLFGEGGEEMREKQRNPPPVTNT